MALPVSYTTGTATVNNATTNVTGQGTTWLTSGIEAGDMFWAAGMSVRIASVESNTSLTLAYAWPGASINASAYEIRYTPEAQRVLASAREVLDSLVADNVNAFRDLEGEADKLPYFTGPDELALADFTAAARDLLDDTSATAMRATLGLGSIATTDADPLSWASVAPSLLLRLTSLDAILPHWFTRSSTGTFFDRFGVMQTAAANVPRIDFDPVTGRCRGLLLEGARTNLLLWSEDISTWTQNASPTITLNAGTAPDGTMTADLLELSGNVASGVFRSVGDLVAAQMYTFSVFIRPASGAGLVRLDSGNVAFGTTAFVIFDTESGAVISNSDGLATISQRLVDGWWRFSVSRIASTSGTGAFTVYSGTTSANSFLAWGTQLEGGAFPSSYIKTEGSAVTRTADVFEIPAEGWEHQPEWTIFIEGECVAGVDSQVIADVGPTSGFGQSVYISVPAAGGGISLSPAAAPVNVSINLPLASAGFRAAAAMKPNDAYFSANGASGSDVSCEVPAEITSLRLGFGGWAGGVSASMFGHIKTAAFFPRREPNATVEAMAA